eukprot:1971579-Lingulodinium_polyedra.AAC.1
MTTSEYQRVPVTTNACQRVPPSAVDYQRAPTSTTERQSTQRVPTKSDWARWTHGLNGHEG